MNHRSSDLTSIVQQTIDQLGTKLVIGTPLGLGKPIALLNEFYRRALADASIELSIITALSLSVPKGKSTLERRFLEPFTERHFGLDYPNLEYLDDLVANRLPPNVSVTEFYLPSGARLRNRHAQSHYISSNYTHVSRDMLDRGINVLLQAIPSPRTIRGTQWHSLGLNPDVTLDLIPLLKARGEETFVSVAQIMNQLPFTAGPSLIQADFFDYIVDEQATHKPFALPRGAISDTDYAIGLHASALIQDGGTLQLGIGSLGDAVAYGCLLRHQHNEVYRSSLNDIGAISRYGELIQNVGGLARFEVGLQGCSEMITDGFMHLYRAGILKRAGAGSQQLSPDAPRADEVVMRAAFALGSAEFYDFLRDMDDETLLKFEMASVSEINQLYGGQEAFETSIRPGARFINASMKSTALGAAVSDALGNEAVVSGVGGQYNFVAMAHAMEDGRSLLMLRSFRGSGKTYESNIVWQYGHTTIPRHLRDIVVSEYGIADLRGKTDRECAEAMIAIADARCQDLLIREAKSAYKLPADFTPLPQWRENTPTRIRVSLENAKNQGHFQPYPFGSDFESIEHLAMDALGRLKRATSTTYGKIATAFKSVGSGDASSHDPVLARMGLSAPKSYSDRLVRRMLIAALNRKI